MEDKNTFQRFGQYADQEQQQALARALESDGYRVFIKQHGGWGGGTEYVAYRRLIGVPEWSFAAVTLLCIACSLFVLMSGKFGGALVLAAVAALAQLAEAFPEFKASFMWDDGGTVAWDATLLRGNDAELEKVRQIMTTHSGQPVRLRP